MFVLQHEAPILLMTGPAGAGKTATVRVLAREMQLEVQEWTNPVVSSYSSDQFLPEAFNPYGLFFSWILGFLMGLVKII